MKFAEEKSASVESGGRPCLQVKALARQIDEELFASTSQDLLSSENAIACLRGLQLRRQRQ